VTKSLRSVRANGIVVGITMAAMPELSNLFANGIGQNGVYLALLMQRIPSVKRVVLFVPAGEHDCRWMQATFGLEVRPYTEGLIEVDVLIELGWRVDAESIASLHARGGKFVAYVGGNQFVMNLESVACNLPRAEILATANFDSVWVTPQHWRTNLSYVLLTRHAEACEVPHIWSPICLQLANSQRTDGIHYKPTGQARAGGKRIGVFDPNVNVLKTFHIPALVCEAAYRRSPFLIGAVLLFSTEHLREYPHFKELLNTLDVFKAGKMTAEQRFPIFQMLGTHVDVVVTHHWENGLNYLYYDALYLGYPLIHNSESLRDAGYYYKDFDPENGGQVLANALSEHDQQLDSYRRSSYSAWWRASIDNPANVTAYERLLWRLFDTRTEPPMRSATIDSYAIA
jgi:hypothetical protein